MCFFLLEKEILLPLKTKRWLSGSLGVLHRITLKYADKQLIQLAALSIIYSVFTLFVSKNLAKYNWIAVGFCIQLKCGSDGKKKELAARHSVKKKIV